MKRQPYRKFSKEFKNRGCAAYRSGVSLWILTRGDGRKTHGAIKKGN